MENHQQKLEGILNDDLKHLRDEEANTIKSDAEVAHCICAGGRRAGWNPPNRIQDHTRDAPPKKQPAHCVPFAVREKVTDQRDDMESTGVIRPSSSAWASPIVLVRKKDGSRNQILCGLSTAEFCDKGYIPSP